jgi:metallophosphoesterase superfamily enzyme
VFDTVAGAATAIIKGIQKYLGNINENKMTVNEITGYEVANLIGCGDIYNKSKKENQTEDSEINEIKNNFLTYLKKLNKI